MPNNTTNELTIEGDAKQVSKFVQLVSGGDDSKFDFNAIVPMPQDLKYTTSPTTITTQDVIDAERARWEALSEEDKAKSDPKGKYSFGITEEQKNELLEKYGHIDWYDWSVANWGTKWNAYDVDEWYDDGEGYASVRFATAWSPPIEFLVNASNKFKGLTFHLKYGDEGGGFLGESIINSGEIVEDEEYEWFSRAGIAFRSDLGIYFDDSEHEIEGRAEYLEDNPEDADDDDSSEDVDDEDDMEEDDTEDTDSKNTDGNKYGDGMREV